MALHKQANRPAVPAGPVMINADKGTPFQTLLRRGVFLAAVAVSGNGPVFCGAATNGRYMPVAARASALQQTGRSAKCQIKPV